MIARQSRSPFNSPVLGKAIVDKTKKGGTSSLAKLDLLNPIS